MLGTKVKKREREYVTDTTFNQELFLCKNYNCKITRLFCLQRRTQKITKSHFCTDCKQGFDNDLNYSNDYKLCPYCDIPIKKENNHCNSSRCKLYFKKGLASDKVVKNGKIFRHH